MASKLKIIFRSSTDRKKEKKKEGTISKIIQKKKKEDENNKLKNEKETHEKFNTYKKIQKIRLNLKKLMFHLLGKLKKIKMDESQNT